MDPQVSLNLSQLLFFVLTGLIGLTYKNLAEKFKNLKEDYDSKIKVVEANLQEKMSTQRDTFDERSRDRHKRIEDRMSHGDAVLVSIQTAMGNLAAEVKEIRISMAQKFMTKDEFNEAMKREASRLEAIEDRLLSNSTGQSSNRPIHKARQ